MRQQVVPFLRGPGGMPADVITDYYLACMPLGYRAMYRTAALAVDPAAFSKALPYALLAVVLAAVAVAGHGLAGRAGAVLAAATVLASDAFLERMVGGLPRAFAFPALALAAAALVAGRPWWLAATAVGAVAFYPPAALTAGLALAAALVVLPARDRGTAAVWPARRRLLVLAGTAAMALAVHSPTALTCARFGPTLSPADEAAYPEIGPGGRYAADDRAPFPAFAPHAVAAVARMFPGAAAPPGAPATGPGGARTRPVIAVLAGVLGAGLAWQAWHRSSGRRLLALGAAAVAAHALARALAPHLLPPDRYVAYPVPVLAACAVPAAALATASVAVRALRAAWPASWMASGNAGLARTVQRLAAGLGLGFLALAGGRVSADAGWGVRVSPATDLYRAIAALPADALVAGWPAGAVDSVPYLARRRVLLAFETHQAFHRGYADEMRRRASALFAAYFAATWGPVAHLRDAFGVTHLLVDVAHLSGPSPPRYFAPFDDAIAAAWTEGRRRGFVLASPPRAAIGFAEGSSVLLDLRALPRGPAPP